MKHKKRSARIRALALSAAMLFSMIPTTVFAAEGNIPIGASSMECHVEHDEDCGFVEGVAGADCTHACETCGVKDSGTADHRPAQAQCTCDVLCTEDIIHTDCSVCAPEGADLANCKGEAAAAASARDRAAELFTALPDASVITAETTQAVQVAINPAPTSASTQAQGAAIPLAAGPLLPLSHLPIAAAQPPGLPCRAVK